MLLRKIRLTNKAHNQNGHHLCQLDFLFNEIYVSQYNFHKVLFCDILVFFTD